MTTIKEAALTVMERHGQPMTSREVYDAIVEADLYQFNSSAAAHIVDTQIRRYCKGVSLKNSSPNKAFALLEEGRYIPLFDTSTTLADSTDIAHDLLSIIHRHKSAEEHNAVASGDELNEELLTGLWKTTSTKRLIDARLGQGKYRAELEKMWDGRCAVTGCRTAAALRASHIKAWAASTDSERLDKNNGLLLVATLDALFDHFQISFSETGKMLISKHVPRDEYECLGVGGGLRKPPNLRQAAYLYDHRSKFLEREQEIDCKLQADSARR